MSGSIRCDICRTTVTLNRLTVRSATHSTPPPPPSESVKFFLPFILLLVPLFFGGRLDRQSTGQMGADGDGITDDCTGKLMLLLLLPLLN